MSKFGPFAISTRETARLAWRSRVDAAARASTLACHEWQALVRAGKPHGGFPFDKFDALDAALSSSKPWRSGRRPDPRNHYSRRHRRACRMCRPIRQWLRMTAYVTAINHADPYVGRFHRFTRDPHGRSDR